MAIEFLGAASRSGSIGTSFMPPHQAGDYLVAFVTSSTGAYPVVPTGWTELHRGQDIYPSITIYKIAESSSESLTGTNWSSIGAIISVGAYRGVTEVAFKVASNNSFPAVTVDSGSWVVAWGAAERIRNTAPPAGVVKRAGNTGAFDTVHHSLFDTNGEVTSWGGGGSQYNSGTRVVELKGYIAETTGSTSLALDAVGAPLKSGATAQPAGETLTPQPLNGTFETNTSGWFPTFFGETLGIVSRDTTRFRSGVASMKVVEARDAGSGKRIGTSWAQPVSGLRFVPGATYRLSAWVWLSPEVDTMRLAAWFDDGIPIATTGVKGQWVHLTTEGVPSRDVVDIAAELVGNAGATVWVDDVTVDLVVPGLSLDLVLDAQVVRSEGQIKPTDGQVALPPFAIGAGVSKNGAVKAFTITDAYGDTYGDIYEGTQVEGLLLSLALTVTTIKETGVNGTLPLNLPISGQPRKSVTRDGLIPLRLNVTGEVHRVEENLTGVLGRIVAYAPNGDRIGPLPGWQSWNVTIPYGTDLGAFDGDYPWQAPFSETVSDYIEVALEVHDGKKYVEEFDCRWLILNHGWDEGDPTVPIKASGVSMGMHLDKTSIMDGPTDGWTVGERRFTSATAGRYMRTLCDEAKARGALAGVDVSTFTVDTDSAGNPWSQVISMGFTIGTPLSQVVEALVQQGMMEVRWLGRTLMLFDREASSVDRAAQSSPVVLTSGRDLKSAPVQSTITDVATTALVRGDEGLTVQVTNPEANSPWGRWETTLDQSGVDADGLESAGQNVVALTAVGRSQHTNALNFIGAAHLPLLAYRPGDWVISVPGDSSAARDRYRLRQITLSMDTDGVIGGSAVLNDIIVESEVRLKRRMDGVQGGASNAGPMPRPAQGDNTTPAAPTNLVASTSVYLEEGVQRAQVELSWNDPTVNTDGTTLDDLNMVQVWAKPSRAGTTWRFLTAAPAGQQAVTFGPLEVAETYSFRLTAIDYTGHTSDPSNTVTLEMARDTTGPVQPSAPSTSTRNGVVEVSHDGRTNAGGEMPVDFSHFEVYAAQTSSVPLTAAARVGTIAAGASALTLTGWPYNRNIYARVIAVDVSGNKSPASPVSAAAYNDQVGSGDIRDNAVGPNEIDVPALDSAGNLRVNQLDGETINGVNINGGTFKTTNTSQRVELGRVGGSDPTDEVRMWNGGQVSSVRNPSDRPGSLRINAANRIFTFGESLVGDGHHVMHVSGRGILKFLIGVLQVRNASDSGYIPVHASAFTVASEEKFKEDIRPTNLRATEAIKKARSKQWRWKWRKDVVDEDGVPVQSAQSEMGLIAEDLPDEVRDGEGYSVTAVVALLWDALREAHERIDRLENP